MNWFKILDRWLERAETTLIILIVLTMILLSFLQVVLRNFFSTSISWGDIFLRHLVLWIGFIGASLAAREGKHINIDVLSKLLSAKVKRISQVIVSLFSSMVCYFLMAASIGFVRMEQEGSSVLFAHIPTWTIQLIIPIGFGIMMFRFFVRALQMVFDRSVEVRP